MNRRNKAIQFVNESADFVGEMAISSSPIMFFVGMAMLSVSIALRGAIATNTVFDVLWAIVTAICVDGLWLGVWLRLLDCQLTTWANRAKYAATLFVALLMFVVASAMSILVTYQQVNAVADELLAMGSLHIDSLMFTVARGVLVVLCASLAILFRPKKVEVSPEPLAISPKLRAKRANKIEAISPIITEVSPEPLAIAEHSQDVIDGLRATTGSRYELIKEAMKEANEQGVKINLKVISQETGAGYSTVKLYASTIKKELGIK